MDKNELTILDFELITEPHAKANTVLTPGGVLNFELGTDVRPEVSNTTL